MKTRKLGGLAVSELGLGCMSMSSGYGPPGDDAAMTAVIRAAYDAGVTFFDTAQAYGPLLNETLLGAAIEHVRDELVIATKFGFNIGENGARLPGLNSRPENIRAVAEASLRRLRTDRIDLFYQHRVDPAVPMEDVAGAVAQLVAEGKVLHFGLSEAGIGSIRRAHAVLPVAAVQNEFSLWFRGHEALLPALRELGVGLVAFSPVGRGMLTGDVPVLAGEGDIRSNMPRFQPGAFEHNLKVVQPLKDLARAKGVAPATLAIAWVQHQGEDIVSIPGTTRLSHLKEDLAAADLVLSAQDLAAISAAVSEQALMGERYNAAMAASVGI